VLVRGKTEELIRAFIADRFLFDADAAIDPRQSLIKAGVMDSTGVMELVFFLEETFLIKVADVELIPQNLDTLTNIAAFVQRKSPPNGSGSDRA
jgi:acyl carrier protein